MQPERPPLWPLTALTIAFLMNVVFVVTPPVFGGKPYGMTIASALILAFAVMLYRKLWAHHRAHQEHPPSGEDPDR